METLKDFLSDYYQARKEEAERLAPPSSEHVMAYIDEVAKLVFQEIERELRVYLTTVKVYCATKQQKIRIKFTDARMKCEFGLEIRNEDGCKEAYFFNRINQECCSSNCIQYTDLEEISAAVIYQEFMNYFSERVPYLEEKERARRRKEAFYFKVLAAFDPKDPFDYAENGYIDGLSDEEKQTIDAIHTDYFGTGVFTNRGDHIVGAATR